MTSSSVFLLKYPNCTNSNLDKKVISLFIGKYPERYQDNYNSGRFRFRHTLSAGTMETGGVGCLVPSPSFSQMGCHNTLLSD